MKLKVYLEVTRKRTFACATDWPGWCRSGKTEDEALAALVEYGRRYKRALGSRAGSGLALPESVGDVDVHARLTGNATTEFGAPGVVSDADRAPLNDAERERLVKILRAAWRAFDKSAEAAQGKTLATGPRGGGRSLAQIREHVREADNGYISALGAKPPRGAADWAETQAAFIEALRAKVRGELPERGPRGGERWPAGFAVRRSAWHALDHAWEIEDRSS